MKKMHGKLTLGVGNRMKQIRSSIHLNQSQMAAKLGLSQSAYYKNETGETVPGLPTLNYLQTNLDISLDWLLLGKGPMYYRDKHAVTKELTEKLKILENELPDIVKILQSLP